RSKPLDVPGEKKFAGRGVTYCTTRDAPYFREKTVSVIGGGNSALAAVNELLVLGCTVNLVHHEPSLTADSILIEKAMGYGNLSIYHNHDVLEIAGKGTVTGITIRDVANDKRAVLRVAGVFIETGSIPNSSCVRGILNLNDNNEIIVNSRCETNVPGIFAAGDVTNVPDKQIIVAVGEGAKAALGVCDYLLHKKGDFRV
ncbi:MAG: FAD-dependent oxidoreductase, partial [Candidatus Latescibacteria bacterium]|nr:FAD-dependent oxidoreductase [Candidatus Latescibacterota bacterium]